MKTNYKMNFKALMIFQFSVFIILCSGCTRQETGVVVCGTLHGYHKINANYSYDTLFQFISEYKPDIIGIEVRPEDVHHKKLTDYYPHEMTEVIARFEDAEIFGIDWWNSAIEGMMMSDSIITCLPNIVWQKAYSADTVFLEKKPEILAELYEHKLNIAKKASMQEILSGDYDSLTLRYYRELGDYLTGSPHENLYRSYMDRHERIANNIVDVVKSNPGKKMVILVGADHQVYARRKLEETFQDRIQLNSSF